MADTKISALTELTGGNVDTAADLLAIVDTGSTETKKIKVTELVAAVIATQAQMEAASSNAVLATPGRTQYHPGVGKAWVKADLSSGTPTINASHNVSSLGDNGVGQFTVNFTTAFSSAHYAIGTFVQNAGARYCVNGQLGTPPAAGSCALEAFRASSESPADVSCVTAIFLGDQS